MSVNQHPVAVGPSSILEGSDPALPGGGEDVVGGGGAQWRVIWREPGEEEIVEVCSRWDDAWALSRQDPDDNRMWIWRIKEEVDAEFTQGAAEISVAWAEGEGETRCVIIVRL